MSKFIDIVSITAIGAVMSVCTVVMFAGVVIVAGAAAIAEEIFNKEQK